MRERDDARAGEQLPSMTAAATWGGRRGPALGERGESVDVHALGERRSHVERGLRGDVQADVDGAGGVGGGDVQGNGDARRAIDAPAARQHRQRQQSAAPAEPEGRVEHRERERVGTRPSLRTV